MNKADVDVLVGLVSTTHQFRNPQIVSASNVSFSQSFKTVGTHPSAQELVTKADAAREALATCLMAGSRMKVVNASQNYLPLIYQVMVTCISQPDEARLDQRMMFQWASALEAEQKRNKKITYTSEAIMFDLVMTVASQAMGMATTAHEDANAGDFASASRHYKSAAGIMRFLAQDQLPKWAGQGTNVFDAALPSETSVETCEAFEALFLAAAQQMAVSMVLRKPDQPNFGLLAKLCLGIAEQMELFTNTMKGKASMHMQRMDPAIFSYAAFQIKLQRALSMYFLARNMWDSKEGYGLAITMLREAISFVQSIPTGRGSSKIQQKQISEFLKHAQQLLKSWEKDNGTIYYEQPYSAVPEDKRLPNGTLLTKPELFEFNENVAPVPLILPARKMPLGRLFEKVGINS